MFQGAKRRITEGARRAARGSGGVSGSQRDQQAAAATTRSGDSAQDVMDLMLDSGERGRMQHRTSHMSNGKGPSSSNMGGSGGAHNAYFVDDDVVSNDMDMDFFDYGDRLGGGGGGGEQMFSLASMEESIFNGGGGGVGGSGGSMFGPGGAFFSGRAMRLGGQHGGGREPVDKVVHTDFFNKFDDLLDMDDLD